jgi:hypothetical protein
MRMIISLVFSSTWLVVGQKGSNEQKNSEPLLGVLAAGADLRRAVCQDWPAAVVAVDYRLAQHAAHQRTAAAAAAGTGADAGPLAYLFESFGASLNGLNHRAFADLVADAGWLEIFDNRLLTALLFQFVDGNVRPLR